MAPSIEEIEKALDIELPRAKTKAKSASSLVHSGTLETGGPVEVKPRSIWYAAPQPNFKPWSSRLSVLGAVLSLPAIATLIFKSAGSPWHVVSYFLTGLGLMSMFIASAVYHACRGPARAVEILRKLDYGAIALMIVGSFTPFCLTALRTPLSMAVLAAVWSMGGFAIYLLASRRELPVWGLISLYLAMGWLGLLVIYPVGVALGMNAVSLICLGGGIFTVGTIFFNGDETKYKPGRFGRHEVWHVLIILGSACFYAVYYLYLLP